MRRYGIVGRGLVVALALTWPGASSFARDADETPPVNRHGHVIRIYEIGSLTHGRNMFLEHQLGAHYGLKDDAEPTYPFEYEEPIYPHGSADEMIELVKASVEPWFWEENEDAMIAAIGEVRLFVRASPAIHKKLADKLLALDYEQSIHIDLMAVPASASDLSAWAKNPAAPPAADLAKRPDAIRASLRTGEGTRSTITRGRHEALVPRLHAVAEDGVATTEVGEVIGRYGFVATVEAVPHDRGTVVADLRVSLARVAPDKRAPHKEFDARNDRILTWTAHVPLRHRVWKFVGAASASDASGWALFARADVGTPPEPTGPRATYLPPTPAFDPDERLESRRYSIRQLQQLRRNRSEHFGDLRPVREIPRVMPELPDPEPFWNPDSLVEVIQSFTGEGFWELGSLQAINGFLVVRASPRVFPVIEKLIDSETRVASRRVVMDVRIYDTAADAEWTHSAAALDEAAQRGDAKLVHFARVQSMNGQRNATTSGTAMRYVGGYETNAEDGKFVATPAVGEVFLGLVVDLQPQIDVAGSQVHLDVRIADQALERTRIRETPHGRIELPSVQVFRVQTVTRLNLNRAAIVGRVDAAARARIITVTPRIEDEE